MIDATVAVYCCAPSLLWVKDTGQTILVGEGGSTWILRGVEAVTWDLLTLHYPFERLVGFLAALLEVPAEEAGRILDSVLHRWNALGIVIAAEGNACG